MFQLKVNKINNVLVFLRWLSRLNMAAVGYAERERMRQEQGKDGRMDGWMDRRRDGKVSGECLSVSLSLCRLLE